MAQMQDIRITTTAKREIMFTGTAIAEAISEPVDFLGVGVSFRLRIWRKKDGGFAPSISVFVDEERQPRFIESEFVDTPTDVENFFFVFEPGEILDKLISGKTLNEERSDPANRLYGVYERQVTELLAEFSAKIEHPRNKESEPIANPADRG